MRKVLLLLAFFLGGCASETHAPATAVKITYRERTWLSCDASVGGGYTKFIDKETGKTIVVTGNALIEETSISCP